MTTYTAADAANPAIVRAALEAALVSGESRPRVTFTGHYWHVDATIQGNGQWRVTGTFDVCYTGKDFQMLNLTTDQAVTAIVAARNER